jgi:hypothetical protein
MDTSRSTTSRSTTPTNSKLYAIAVFLEEVVYTDNERDLFERPDNTTMSLEACEDAVGENGKLRTDDIGDRLSIVSYFITTDHLPMWKRSVFKEFMLATLRCVSGQHDPLIENKIDTYEFEAPNKELYAIHIGTKTIACPEKNKIVRTIVATATDSTYLKRLKLCISDKLLDAVSQRLDKSNCKLTGRNGLAINKIVCDTFKEYSDVDKADKIGSIRSDLESTRATMRHSLDLVLESGDRLDSFVERSGDLSTKSKKMYKQSKKLNESYCTIA